SSRDELVRFQGVDRGLHNDSVNHGWMCDRGRFNFQAIESEGRLAHPLVRTDDGHVETSWSAAMALVEGLLRDAGTIGLLGGARSTNEGAFAWATLADALGIAHRDAQLGDGLPAEVLGLPRATIESTCEASTVVLLGPDLKEELPVLHLRLRDAAASGRTRLIEFTSRPTGLTRQAWRSVQYVPGAGVSEIGRVLTDPEVVEQLGRGPVVVVAGRGNLAVSESEATAELRAVLDAVPTASVLPALRRGNVVGALQLGLAPSDTDHGAIATLRAAADGRIDVLVLVGADPLHDVPDADLARRALAGAGRVVSVATSRNASNSVADVVLPAAAFGEQSGTTTNLEGRVTPVRQKVTAHGTSRPDWMIAADLAARLGHDLGVSGVDELTAMIAERVPAYAATVDGGFAIGTFGPLPAATPSGQPANSYDFRLVVGRKLYDRAVGTSESPALAGLPIGAGAHVHPLDLDRIGVPDGTDVSLVGNHGTVVLPLVADPVVLRGTLWAPFNQPGTGDVATVIDAASGVTDVRIERLS
ncbi:MAG: molybdopterin oxidoreductase family protein, partial [Ilumatobacteraceae bacterium]